MENPICSVEYIILIIVFNANSKQLKAYRFGQRKAIVGFFFFNLTSLIVIFSAKFLEEKITNSIRTVRTRIIF